MGKELVGMILIFISISILIGGGAVLFDKISNDSLQKANCNALERNGHNIRLETVTILLIPYKDCYVQVNGGKYVPYDRYRGIGEE